MTQPLVSVIMPSYNHERHIGSAIQSVLAQTYQHLELVVTDDGSRDSSPSVIQSFDDPRIKPHFFEHNQGACAAVNDCIRRSSGEYIAMISSDDLWKPDKLAIQVDFLQTHPQVGAVFAIPEFIDSTGNILSRHAAPDLYATFPAENKTRAQWLHHFFTKGNRLCHPSMLIRKSCYDALGGYDNRLRQLPDFDMWIRFCKRFELHILDQPLIQFRWFDDGSNTSAPTGPNMARIHNELFLIFETFFDGMDPESLNEGFELDLPPEGPDRFRLLEIAKTLLYFRPDGLVPDTAQFLIGLRRLHAHLADHRDATLLATHHGISELNFHERCAASGALHAAFIVRGLDPANCGQASAVPTSDLLRELGRRSRRATPAKIARLLASLFRQLRHCFQTRSNNTP